MRNTETLKQRLDGTIILPGNPGYDEARSIWNGMIDRKPALIVRCRSEGDVMRAVEYARENQLIVAIRGGGHNIAGHAVCDGGLMIDLSTMKEVRVDAPASRAYVQPGATLADVDRSTQAHGLATPTGINSTTGIAGLALGGGFGWLSRKLGLTSDNLVSARIVNRGSQMPSCQRDVASGSVLGLARRRRKFWRCDANFVMNVHGRWNSRAEDKAGIAWAREVYRATIPFATGGAYSNFLTAEETDRVKSAFGSNYARLAQVKKTYDPGNFFRLNQNIRPE